jgi:hypothetical protein
MILKLDADDERDINAAIAHYQATQRWDQFGGEGGVFLPEGESDLAGAILGEICRMWLESRGALRQDG